MHYVYVLLGTLVLLLVITDVVGSTLTAARGGILARRLGRLIWVLTNHAPFAGALVLVATAALWVGLFWLGWTLVFLGAPEAVVSASNGDDAGFWERVYFAGYTVITLGLGDFVPSTPLWRVLTVLAAATGLVFITLAVTYYTAALSAVVHKRQLASFIRALGDSPSAIVTNTWDGDGFNGLGSVLTTLGDHLARHSQQHYAYPVLHYFGARTADDALAVQLARLGDALVLWADAVAPAHRPPPGPLRLAHGAFRDVLRTLQGNFVAPAVEAPRPPDLAPLQAVGIPLTSEAEHVFSVAPVQAERRLCLGFVRDARFAWSKVTGPTTH